MQGISIRIAKPADAEAIARVHVAAWHRAYRGLIADSVIDARTVEVRTQQWTPRLREDELIAFVACDDEDAIVGFATAVSLDGSHGGFEAYLQTLYVSPQAWHRGIGRALLAAVADRLRVAGAKNMALRTLRLGDARRFYERLGARLVPEGLAYDEDHLNSVVYAFDDLDALAARTRA
jgi:GNAT superfamily N-acetyltransferase